MSGAIAALAAEAGVLVDWEDASGAPRTVSPEALEGVLEGLGLPCGDEKALRSSRSRLSEAASRLRPLYTALPGGWIDMAGPSRGVKAAYRLEDGSEAPAEVRQGSKGAQVRAPKPLGYHELRLGEAAAQVAVCPPSAFTVEDACKGEAVWGTATQIYALRESGGGKAFGDFGDLKRFAAEAARVGADALAISPVHALRLADPSRFSPYAPSSRLFLNGLLADLERLGPAAAGSAPQAGPLIDWPSAWPQKVAALRAGFQDFKAGSDKAAAAFRRFCADGGERLLHHALFEAIHERQSAEGVWFWRDWPEDLRSPTAPGALRVAREIPESVEFHLFVQWLADESLEAAQAAARAGGMRIGLIADLAVGTDAGGSHAWSRPDELLDSLSVGAPPDLFQADGQSWGVAAVAPRALVDGGYGAFIDTLRAAFRHAGGARIDHAMGLRRLWMVPSGASPREGAYLAYPFEDLLRLLCLESRRAQSVVVAEDLGTVPAGFREALHGAGILGMNVLWFETEDSGFLPPSAWGRSALAMTSTHDLPTVAGWWRGRDLEWNARLGRTADEAGAQAERSEARAGLWKTFKDAGLSEGVAPAAEDAARVVDAACAFVAETPCPLALPPIEDLLGLEEQINLPGVVADHPNWRRRLAEPLATALRRPQVRSRIDRLNARKTR